MKTKDKWIEIGEVGVDSGNLIVCDPCYIDSQWKKEEFEDIRDYQDIKTKKIYRYQRDFPDFAHRLDRYAGKNPNELIAEGRWKKVPEKEVKGFSYNAACHKGDKLYKQLNYELGHAGVGVAFNSGLGDGSYKVMARIGIVKGWGERVKEIRIKLC